MLKKIKSIFWSEEDSTAKLYVQEELEHLVYLKCVIQKVIKWHKGAEITIPMKLIGSS